MSGSIKVGGKRVALDKEGYLRNLDDWNEAVAEALAQQQEITLRPAHWEILNLLREFHQRHELSPATRALVSLVKKKLGPDKGRSIYLMRLFRGSFAKTASRIAGLPKPDNCL
ncbi:MAG: TusE/DsrC/DsvC family sulfur relay protein [Gammaproteobacteria bacterium]|nr:TusE/DsrC/DsvC family sulfur relay protein [Gammaproteobacteria bacterium]MYH86810.1 TusE/DsrC/DsvC family sulfur relay protein [Gammaproteobacteria bacterium]MYK04225.1 TusE/DsrC/DsvC family sulfur relay protein [Gammaproteobacteria bacterium]